MTIKSIQKKQLHEMIDTLPDDMDMEEIMIGFREVLVRYLSKSMLQGFNTQMDDLQFCHDIMDNGGPEKNANVIRLPKLK